MAHKEETNNDNESLMTAEECHYRKEIYELLTKQEREIAYSEKLISDLKHQLEIRKRQRANRLLGNRAAEPPDTKVPRKCLWRRCAKGLIVGMAAVVGALVCVDTLAFTATSSMGLVVLLDCFYYAFEPYSRFTHGVPII